MVRLERSRRSLRLGSLFRPLSGRLLRRQVAVGDVLPYISIPGAVNWGKHVSQGANGVPDYLGNDRYLNCVPVAALRLMQTWRWNVGDKRNPSVAQALDLYRRWADFDPANPATDRGTYTDTAYADWSSRGYQWEAQTGVSGNWFIIERDGTAPNLQSVKVAIFALGGVLATLILPQSAMQTGRWDEPPPGTPQATQHGYHEVAFVGYDDTERVFWVMSWGTLIPMSYTFAEKRILRASAFASINGWVAPNSHTPSGLTRDQMRSIGRTIIEH